MQAILLVKKWGDFTIIFENPISIAFSFACLAKHFVAGLSRKQVNNTITFQDFRKK